MSKLTSAQARVEFLTARLTKIRAEQRDARKAGKPVDKFDARLARRNEQLVTAKAALKAAQKAERATAKPAKPAGKVAAKAPAKAKATAKKAA